ncbi:DEAD/DEAH box helicase [Paenibacillus camerounensis]|uniref:DEAD/DEAH box helicase n=1 Tax=Paenibacillus camerounensis TaxID=1243663 RepID=UPI0005A5DD21|nr:DEAD/DEAH box helicase [Paenibacillus camerounensis]
MSNSTLPEKLFSIPGFHKRYMDLVVRSVKSQFSCFQKEENNIDWNYMLLCASILANSEDGKCLDAALRIAQFCLINEVLDNQKAAAAVIMDTLTNSPSIKLAIERKYLSENYEYQVPSPLLLERIGRDMKYSIYNSKTESLQKINKFQWLVYQGVNSFDWVSISAPTSAGKSYILLRILEEHFIKSQYSIAVYIVPTRALIQQVELDIIEAFNKYGLDNITISSIPALNEDWRTKSQIYIFTQERLLWILNEEPDFIPDIVITDEAQKIGDGSRGILLQQAIEELTRRSTSTKFLFSSPSTENPEIFLEDAPESASAKPIQSEYIAVNQNLLWASQVPRKPKEWSLSLCNGETSYSLGGFNIDSRPTHESKRLPLVAYALADKRGGNLLYVNGAADAEKTAMQLWDLLGDKNNTRDQEVIDLIELSAKSINSKYSLNVVLSRGVGFHYGNMPLLIKAEIERLFKSGKLEFLVCTSTLIEGVNLPAKSIFMRGPKKGKGRPLSEIDFWNLAGRAGRQGKEFQGNVICIDPNVERVWNDPPPTSRKKYNISRTVDEIIEHNSEHLLKYIEELTPRVKANAAQEYEYAFTYFLAEYMRRGSFDHLEGKYDSIFLSTLSGMSEEVLQKVELPESILLKNPGISPYAQQDLFQYFKSYDDDLSDLIPSLPEDEDALDNYCALIDRISKYLSGDVPELTYAHALLVLNWLRGWSLSRIIDRNWRYWNNKIGKTKKLDAVIRDTMRDLEEYARFKFLKYSSCYNDILQFYLESINQAKLAEEVPQLKLWLEFGASQKTQISLMALGMSRTSAVMISEYITSDSFEPEDCLKWLRSMDVEVLGFSPIVVAEILKVLTIHN